MSDNSQAGAAVGVGDLFASDDIGGVKWPRAKIAWGIDGVAVDTSAVDPLPVVQTGTPALPTGAATETTLSAINTKVPATLGQKAMAASLAVVVASDQSTLPVSAASLPLPTGAATETTLAAASAKLPATLGQKAMAASMAVVLASDQSSVPVAATLTAETTKVIGTVNIAASQTIAVTNAGTFAAQVTGTKTNNSAAPGATNVGSLPVVATAANPSFTEGNQVGISSDLSGRIRTDASTIAGTATVVAAAGVQKVGIVGNANGAIDAAMAAAVPANGIHIGGKAATANPTNATAGNLTPFMLDKAGRLVVVRGHVRELIGTQRTALAATGETTIITAGGAGVFNDLASITITTAGAAAATLTIRDATAGTTRYILNYPNAAIAPGAPLHINFDPPIPQAAANANWTIQNSVATGVNITCTFVKNL